MISKRIFGATISTFALGWAVTASAQTYGPFNATAPAGGDSVKTPIGGANAPAIAATSWTLSGWVEPKTVTDATVLIAGFGEPAPGP